MFTYLLTSGNMVKSKLNSSPFLANNTSTKTVVKLFLHLCHVYNSKPQSIIQYNNHVYAELPVNYLPKPKETETGPLLGQTDGRHDLDYFGPTDWTQTLTTCHDIKTTR